MTLKSKNSVVYKYGCSDPTFNNLGGMPFLFWKTILEAKADGATEFDLGRSDLGNKGLLEFKDRLGSNRSALLYYSDAQSSGQVFASGRSAIPSESYFPEEDSSSTSGPAFDHGWRSDI